MSLDFLQLEFLSNQVSDYLIALAILFGGFVTIKLLRCTVLEHLKQLAKKTTTTLDDVLLRLIERGAIPLLYLGVVYIAISNLTLHPILHQALSSLMLIIATIFGIRLLVSLADYSLRLYWITRRDGSSVEPVLSALVPAIRTTAWALGVIFLLDNLGFDISAVLAGVGIGGVALALASQGVLQDLFSYFAILFDRPFELGDFVVVDDMTGTIKHVGIKTTRVQSLSGEEVVIPNTKLTGSRIHNFKRMLRRRVVFQFGVQYGTTQEQLQQIPPIVKQIIEAIDNTTFDRAHFFEYGEYGLIFEVVYYVFGNDYNLYMDIQQQINLSLKQKLEQHRIEFAYPTQILHLSGLPDAQPIQTANRVLVTDGKGMS